LEKINQKIASYRKLMGEVTIDDLITSEAELNAELKKRIDYLATLTDPNVYDYKELLKTIEEIQKKLKGISTDETQSLEGSSISKLLEQRRQLAEQGAGNEGLAKIDDMIEKERFKSLAGDLGNDLSSTLQNAFSGFWSSIFGEADNAFDALIQSWLGKLAEFAATSLLSNILLSIFPTSGFVTSLVSGLTGSPMSGGGISDTIRMINNTDSMPNGYVYNNRSPQAINIKLDANSFMPAITKYQSQSISKRYL
jgi:hypothetical protein